ncbi:hypothetical protein TNCV_4185131 [Trichonephila clavipes]|nr:hypothetical protein TNCV_4185131 [Trichonephila clavipes]
MPKREGPYLKLALRSPVTYEIANPDQALGTYHVPVLKDYQEPETERSTRFVAPPRKRGRPKKKLPPGSKLRRQRNQRGTAALLNPVIDVSSMMGVSDIPDCLLACGKKYSPQGFLPSLLQSRNLDKWKWTGFPADLPDDMSFSESDTEDKMEERRSPSPLLTPPSDISRFRNNLLNCQASCLCINIGLDISESIKRVDLYHFEDEFSKNICVAELNALFEESRAQFHKQRIEELESGSKLFEELKNNLNPDSLQHSTLPQQDEGAFQLVKVHLDEENEDVTSASVNHNAVRPPPPITIDNVKLPNQLLKKLQDTTQQKLRGRMVGKGFRIYPKPPEAYHAIRRYIDAEKLEAFTYQLPDEKEIKAVIRGMPADTPPQEIIEDLLTWVSLSTNVTR